MSKGLHDAPLIAGVDEAGRGPLAGPVVAAAVILAPGGAIVGLGDSKQISQTRRSWLDREIRAQALCWSIGLASVAEIDSLNIHRATLKAMRRAVLALRILPASVLVDGRFIPELPGLRVHAEVGGDRRIEVIGAASIIAKQARDAIMRRLHDRYPEYGFDAHKGYPTSAHRLAIQRFGICEHHRRTFAPVREALETGCGSL